MPLKITYQIYSDASHAPTTPAPISKTKTKPTLPKHLTQPDQPTKNSLSVNLSPTSRESPNHRNQPITSHTHTHTCTQSTRLQYLSQLSEKTSRDHQMRACRILAQKKAAAQCAITEQRDTITHRQGGGGGGGGKKTSLYSAGACTRLITRARPESTRASKKGAERLFSELRAEDMWSEPPPPHPPRPLFLSLACARRGDAAAGELSEIATSLENFSPPTRPP